MSQAASRRVAAEIGEAPPELMLRRRLSL